MCSTDDTLCSAIPCALPVSSLQISWQTFWLLLVWLLKSWTKEKLGIYVIFLLWFNSRYNLCSVAQGSNSAAYNVMFFQAQLWKSAPEKLGAFMLAAFRTYQSNSFIECFPTTSVSLNKSFMSPPQHRPPFCLPCPYRRHLIITSNATSPLPCHYIPEPPIFSLHHLEPPSEPHDCCHSRYTSPLIWGALYRIFGEFLGWWFSCTASECALACVWW